LLLQQRYIDIADLHQDTLNCGGLVTKRKFATNAIRADADSDMFVANNGEEE